MELINPYAVMRNTATHEAYKAYSRKAAMAWAPFITLAFVMLLLIPVGSMAARTFLRGPLADWRIALACFAGPVFLAGVFMIVGVANVLRFRRENPIPDEWRQVPRSNPLRYPGRKLPPPAQG